MTNKKISEEDTIPSLSGAELVRLAYSDANYKTTLNDILALIAGGSDTQVLFKDGSVITGDDVLTWDKSNNILTIGGNTVSIGGYASPLQVGFDPSSRWGPSIIGYGNNASIPAIVFGKTRGANPATHGDVTANTRIGGFSYYGSLSGAYRFGGNLEVTVYSAVGTQIATRTTIDNVNTAGNEYICGHFYPEVGSGAMGCGTNGANPPARTLHPVLWRENTNTVAQIARLGHWTSGTPAAGIGAGLEFEIQTAAGSPGNREIGAIIEALATDVTPSSEAFDLVLKVMAGGAAADERLRLTDIGAQFKYFGSTTYGYAHWATGPNGDEWKIGTTAGHIAIQPGDEEAIHITTGGNIGINGHSIQLGGSYARMYIAENYNDTLQMHMHLAGCDHEGPWIQTTATGHATDPNTKAMMADGDYVFLLSMLSSTDTSYEGGGAIQLTVDGTPYEGMMPTKMSFMVNRGIAGYHEQLALPANGVSYFRAVSDTITNEVHNTLKLNFTTNATPAAGIGVSLSFETMTNGSYNKEIGGIIESVSTNVTTGSEAFDMVFKVMSGGAPAAQALRLLSSGVASLGSAVIGHSNTVAVGAITRKFQVHSTAATDSGMVLGYWANNLQGSYWDYIKSRGGSPGTHGIIVSGDVFGGIQWMADDGVSYLTVAGLTVKHDTGTPGVGDISSVMSFYTRAAGAGGTSERMKIDSAGLLTIFGSIEQYYSTTPQMHRIYATRTDADNWERVSLGYDSGNSEFILLVGKAGSGQSRSLRIQSTADLNFYPGAHSGFVLPTGGEFAMSVNASTRFQIDGNASVRIGLASIATTATAGFLYVAACAGPPSGVPNSVTGMVPIVVDTTNHKLYFYSGGSWRDAGP